MYVVLRRMCFWLVLIPISALGKTRKSLQASGRPSTKRFESFKHFLSVMSKYFTGRLTDLATYIIGRISEIPRPVPLPYKHWNSNIRQRYPFPSCSKPYIQVSWHEWCLVKVFMSCTGNEDGSWGTMNVSYIHQQTHPQTLSPRYVIKDSLVPRFLYFYLSALGLYDG